MGDNYYIGIDLGMINSVLAYTDEDGNIEIQHWNNGYSRFPSVVLMTPRANYAGYPALERKDTEPKCHLVSNFKRMLGTDHKQKIFETEYRVTELYAMILRKMLSIFEEDHGYKVEKAVIAVPADFGDAEREATLKVSKIAGIKDTVIINEADAAAISYYYDNEDISGNVAVYDIGGGTFDVTILSVDENGFTVLSNEGSKYLGGRDWDLHLASIIQKKVVNLTDLTPSDMDSDGDLRRRILDEAERLKIILDRVDTANGSVCVNGNRVRFRITRRELDNATSGLVNRTVEMTRTAIESAGINGNDLNRIVLVGGPSITPLIRTSLEEAFPEVEIIRYDPVHAVAKGAAEYARSAFGDGDLNLRSVLSKTYGLKMGIDGEEKVCNIIYRNTPLPLKRTVTCRPKADDLNELEIVVYSTRADPGEDSTDLETARLVNSFTLFLEGRITRSKTKIDITFTADVDGTMGIDVSCNGHNYKCDLGKDVYMTEEETLSSIRKVWEVQ